MAEPTTSRRDLADDFNVRDPWKLYQLARQRDLDVTQAMAFEALKADVGRRPRETLLFVFYHVSQICLRCHYPRL